MISFLSRTPSISLAIFFGLVIAIFAFVLYLGVSAIMKGSQAKSALKEEANLKNDEFENQINVEIKSAEKEIEVLKNNSSEKINKIAIETSQDLIKKLIGTEINNSSISAIVEDLSKKNKEKLNEI